MINGYTVKKDGCCEKSGKDGCSKYGNYITYTGYSPEFGNLTQIITQKKEKHQIWATDQFKNLKRCLSKKAMRHKNFESHFVSFIVFFWSFLQKVTIF